MRLIQVIGLFNILMGLVAFLAPVKFYSAATTLFTPSVSPPFNITLIQNVTFFLFLPGFILLVNGVALLALGNKLERVPELKAFSESGEFVGALKGVELEEGGIEKLEIGGEESEIIPREDLVALDDVLIVKGEEKSVKHEFAGKEVYSQAGEYFGKVESVELGTDKEVVELTTVKGNKKRVIKAEDIASHNEVIIVKLR